MTTPAEVKDLASRVLAENRELKAEVARLEREMRTLAREHDNESKAADQRRKVLEDALADMGDHVCRPDREAHALLVRLAEQWAVERYQPVRDVCKVRLRDDIATYLSRSRP